MSLATGGPLEGERARALAELLEVSVRTLRRVRAEGLRLLRGGPGDGGGRVGRPAHSPALMEVARELVRPLLEASGWRVGEPRLVRELKELGVDLPVRVVRDVLRVLKAERRRHLAASAAERRVTVDVCARDAIWCQDATQLGRCWQGASVEVARDPATRLTAVSAPAKPCSGEGAVAWLSSLIERSGHAPLVLSTDNGSAYRSAVFERYLEGQGIVHLVNLPRTPQHNANAERAVGELKRRLGLARGAVVRLAGLEERVRRTVRGLNEGLRRRVLGGKTAAAAARASPVAERLVDRAHFYAETCSAMEKAVQGCPTRRAARLAEREAIYGQLERHELIMRHRGSKDGAKLNAAKSR